VLALGSKNLFPSLEPSKDDRFGFDASAAILSGHTAVTSAAIMDCI